MASEPASSAPLRHRGREVSAVRRCGARVRISTRIRRRCRPRSPCPRSAR
jgi:hypothetical protein